MDEIVDSRFLIYIRIMLAVSLMVNKKKQQKFRRVELEFSRV